MARVTRRRAGRVAVGVGLSLILAGTGGMAPASAQPAPRGPAATAAKAGSPVRLDGVLDDDAWSRAPVIDGLVQVEPVEGAAPSEDTEIRVAFDADNLYFGILCRDRTPSAIVSTQLARDAELDVDDHIALVIDPFSDQRNGFFFIVNPAGARADGQISNNARNLSVEWDGIWDARARITAEGWVAEVAIPFKTLRFKPGQTVWGLNVQRQIKRRQEVARWAGARNDVWVSNLAAAGRLGGLEGLHQGKGLDIRPFASGGETNSDWTSKIGLDVVKSLTPNMTAAVTVNTDFAETEVDSAQVNLTRFPLFFPEKRSFFLEGAGVYDVAGLAGSGGPGPPPDLDPVLQPQGRPLSRPGDPAAWGPQGVGPPVGLQHRDPRRPDPQEDAAGRRARGREPLRPARQPQHPRAVVGRGDRDAGRPVGRGRQQPGRLRRPLRDLALQGRPEREPRAVRPADRRHRGRVRLRLRLQGRVPQRPLAGHAGLQADRRRLQAGARLRAADRHPQGRGGAGLPAAPQALWHPPDPADDGTLGDHRSRTGAPRAGTSSRTCLRSSSTRARKWPSR